MTADYLKPKATRHKKSAVKRRHRQIAYLAICSLSVIIFGFALATLIRPTHAADADGTGMVWREGYEGFGTTHEQNHLPHYPHPEYTPYKHTTNYTKSPKYFTEAMDPVYNFTHLVFDKFFVRKTALPPGYIVVKDQDSLALGPKVDENDWRDLLQHYWIVLIFVFIMLLLVIIVPFIAVCYCCFCCCRNCKEGCPPCDSEKDGRKRCCYGLMMLLLIIGLLFGVIIAFVTNKMLDSGFDDTSNTLRRASDDTCTFLKDVSEHIHHLFVKNYEEMETNLNDILKNVPRHIYLDLMDTSELNLLYELQRIFNNTKQAVTLLTTLQKLDKELRFNTAQLRDLLRGAKLNVNHACTVLCGNRECLQFLKNTQIEFLDNSRCLHLDNMPNSTTYLLAMRDILTMDTANVTTAGIKRVEEIEKHIKRAIEPLTPKITSDIRKGQEQFLHQANSIRNIIDSVLMNIHTNTLKSTRTFDDVYERFGVDRSFVSVAVCVFLLVILFVLVISLVCGCCGRRRRGYRDDCCSKGTGATCLLFAILLIFCVFSVTVLVGLFYFILGMTTYTGACAPLRDQEKNDLFRQIDSVIDLNRYLPHSERVTETPLPPLRISNAIKACHADESIFELMQKNNLYDINELERIKVLRDPPENKVPIFRADYSNFSVFTKSEREELQSAANSNMSRYKGAIFLSHICKTLTPVDLPTMANQLRQLRSSLWSQWGIYDWARTALENEAFNLEKIYDEFYNKIITGVTKITETVAQIDKLILYNNLPYGESIYSLLEATSHSEKFLKERGQRFVNALIDNATRTVEGQIESYVQMLIAECSTNVGKCAPLAYIFDRSVDHICKRIVDPMNGFWVGVLLCGVLFLPVLFVAHRLLCLYKKIDPYSAPAVGIVEGGSDYLYDAYSEREREHEHVPLANVPKKRRKAYERRREQQDYYEDASPGVSRSRGGGGMANGGGDAAGGSNMRYNDVAPTHWDHEPPRYHNPPVAPPSSEYERPPPYYYPGASDQD
ncbi:prominin-like protein isoform X1 [Drosophila albomicans]|uniref:Prominin-like protein isoform X1 n=1 Tax=Drosophila albomicans TaxID=7291 RepID=A0A6P8WG64_DROAB|nr:prominin-like protein isoform X1 [Drosophila albomicans]XP_034102649.1 prominin-like protein isoform X1 [Drosophila albomicans]XP_034102651.1 prominin-like protein isoform X1 [Drosophila albomicans]